MSKQSRKSVHVLLKPGCTYHCPLDKHSRCALATIETIHLWELTRYIVNVYPLKKIKYARKMLNFWFCLILHLSMKFTHVHVRKLKISRTGLPFYSDAYLYSHTVPYQTLFRIISIHFKNCFNRRPYTYAIMCIVLLDLWLANWSPYINTTLIHP